MLLKRVPLNLTDMQVIQELGSNVDSQSKGPGCGLNICILNKLPTDANAQPPGGAKSQMIKRDSLLQRIAEPEGSGGRVTLLSSRSSFLSEVNKKILKKINKLPACKSLPQSLFKANLLGSNCP